MKLNFRIDWGYQYLYSRRHYHPVYIWDGALSCEGGTIEKVYRLDYPVIWFGPGHSPKETLLSEPRWSSRTKRGLAGLRVEADAPEEAVFTLQTASGTFRFSAAQVERDRHMEFPVGPKYLGCRVSVTRVGFSWFRPEPKPGETVFEAGRLPLAVHEWSRTRLAWLPPGGRVSVQVDVPDSGADRLETVFRTVAMAAPGQYTPDHEERAAGEMPFRLLCDGSEVLAYRRFYRWHDHVIQMLEDDWKRICLPAGRHTLTLVNKHPSFALAIQRIIVSFAEYRHGQLSVPEWALCGERVTGKVFAARPDCFTLLAGGRPLSVRCAGGWNEFSFTAEAGGVCTVENGSFAAQVEIFDCAREEHPVKVGFDLTAIPHDRNGYLDWLLDYACRTKLGNYVAIRSFTGPPKQEDLYDWGKFAREHGLYVSACVDFMDGALARGAGAMLHDCGRHEYTGPIYCADPQEPYTSSDMRTASEKFTAYLKEEIDRTHTVCPCAAFGDPSGGVRYAFLAGADFVRAETMVPHTMALLSQTRPAAEALGQGRWGVHIAIQHCYQPYTETHLGQYFLSLMQPWMMGAEVIYEEDSLFAMWSDERETWDDRLVKGKRDMTRRFYKFAATHARPGKCTRRIAFLEGRYAAPFNGFICDAEQDPHYSVWGAFGNNAPEWGHGQPEKCRQILDVLMKGASTHPLRQKFDRRRFFFSGTPFGDFDCAPIEASGAYLGGYRLLLNLGWNTMIDEDHEKLRRFAEDGGVLLTGIPQFSTHVRRDFLREMEDLALYRDGDLRELCGIRVRGRGALYSGQWNSAFAGTVREPELSAMPSDSTEEDGAAHLCDVALDGAECIAWDAATGAPMLVRRALGKGAVYTFTLYAYPGHEKFQRFCAAWTEFLCCEARGDVYVEDPSQEVFWSVWEEPDGARTLMLLNTDWSSAGNEKPVTVVAPGSTWTLSVREREAALCRVDGGTCTISRVSL